MEVLSVEMRQEDKALRGVQITGSVRDGFAGILTPEAMAFIAALQRKFNPVRESLLVKRMERQKVTDNGRFPGFLPETAHIRESEWTVDPPPSDLQDRRVEITGPAERKMIINALNSGAKTFMADFEDSNSPTWNNIIGGQINLMDAVKRTITYQNPVNGKYYELNREIAALMVRPRGWHLTDKHVLIDKQPVSASLLDFSLFFFHNTIPLLERGTGPYFYLPKMESHLEARLWNDVFVFAQDYLGIPQGTIKATVLIETILASFELNEILWELRRHTAGLNCGRWDYIFSFIKQFRNHRDFILPDRAQVTMSSGFLRAYSLLVIQTCHKRGTHAIGGMAAQIPIKDDPAANEHALEKVRQDKIREVKDGHDGTWVAHPGLVQIATDVFNTHMPWANQIHRKREDVYITAKDLLEIPEGTITEEGIKTNIDVGIRYLASWLCGNGCVPLYNLMEDAATAEISRAQLWQWVHNPATRLDDGRKFTYDLYRSFLSQQLQKIREKSGEQFYTNGKFGLAAEILDRLITSPVPEEFLTIPAYQYL